MRGDGSDWCFETIVGGKHGQPAAKGQKKTIEGKGPFSLVVGFSDSLILTLRP